jgi:hypothetical protein
MENRNTEDQRVLKFINGRHNNYLNFLFVLSRLPRLLLRFSWRTWRLGGSILQFNLFRFIVPILAGLDDKPTAG